MDKEHSWDILSSKVAEKVLDRSVFLHNSTGIPVDIRHFFGVENLKKGDKNCTGVQRREIFSKN